MIGDDSSINGSMPSNSSELGKAQDRPIFLINTVANGGRRGIEITFEILIFQRKERPFDWYKKLGLDKSIASKIRRGIIIPPKWLRIRIADHFQTDSSNIWNLNEMALADGVSNE